MWEGGIRSVWEGGIKSVWEEGIKSVWEEGIRVCGRKGGIFFFVEICPAFYFLKLHCRHATKLSFASWVFQLSHGNFITFQSN